MEQHVNGTSQSQDSFKRREWMCFYCKEQKLQNVSHFTRGTLNELYDHWNKEHSSTADHSSASTSAEKSFRFYAVDLLECQVGKCKYYSTFRGIRKHYQSKHKEVRFVPIFNGRCAFCFATNENMDEHRCDESDFGLRLRMFNPIPYTNEELAELQCVFERKKFQCLICKQTTETKLDMTKHHHQQHA